MKTILVRPYGIPEEWVFQMFGEATDIEIAIEIQTYLYTLGVKYFTVTHYGKSNVDIAIEDINLN